MVLVSHTSEHHKGHTQSKTLSQYKDCRNEWTHWFWEARAPLFRKASCLAFQATLGFDRMDFCGAQVAPWLLHNLPLWISAPSSAEWEHGLHTPHRGHQSGGKGRRQILEKLWAHLTDALCNLGGLLSIGTTEVTIEMLCRNRRIFPSSIHLSVEIFPFLG